MYRLQAVLCSAALVAPGCRVNLSVPDASRVACDTSQDCPGKMVCKASLGRCVVGGSSDTTAPSLVGTSVVQPSQGTIGTVFSLEFVVSEALGRAPEAYFGTDEQRRTWALSSTSDPENRRYSMRYEARSGDDELATQTTIHLVDEVGNEGTATAPALVLDFTPPTLWGFAWQEPPDAAGPLSVLHFVADTDTTATAIEAQLLDADGSVLASIPVSRVAQADAGTTFLHLDGLVDLSILVPSLLADLSSVTVRLSVADELGNSRAPESLAPIPFDGVAPSVSIAGHPDPISGSRIAEFELASNDADVVGFECSIDGEEAVPCAASSSWLLEHAGAHSFSARAVDHAGNRSDPAAAHQWTVTVHWQRVEAGEMGTCAIATDTSLWCWGAAWAREPQRVVEDLGWVDLSVGTAACAIREWQQERSLWCWGGSFPGTGTQWPADPRVPRLVANGDWRQVVVSQHGSALANETDFRVALSNDGRLWWWGSTGPGTGDDVVEPELTTAFADWSAVAVGDEFCGLRGGALYCGSRPSAAPTQKGSGTDWTEIVMGSDHGCGIREAGDERTLWCWSSFSNPYAKGSDIDWQSVTAHQEATCGIRAGGVAYCFGSSEGPRFSWDWPAEYCPDGYISSGGACHVSQPETFNTEQVWKRWSLGLTHTCALRDDDTVWCWGANENAELGSGWPTGRYEPGKIESPTVWSAVQAVQEGDATPQYTVGLDQEGKLWAWGAEETGQVLGLYPWAGRPREILPQERWAAIEGIGDAFCGIKLDSTLWCWGSNDHGELGFDCEQETDPIACNALALCEYNLICDGSLVTTPVQIESSNDWLQLAAASNSFFGVRGTGTQGTLWAWGFNAQDVEPVGSADDWLLVEAGPKHACGIRDDGGNNSLWCWWWYYNNTDIGVDPDYCASNDCYAPSPVTPTNGWKAVSVGMTATCGIRDASAQHKLYCWGDGIALPASQLPAQVGNTEGSWQAVSVADEHACAVKMDGSLWCWGHATAGRLGFQAAFSTTSEPRQVGTDMDWIDVVTARRISCARKQDGSLWCFGDNSYGQLGNGEAWGPVQVRLAQP